MDTEHPSLLRLILDNPQTIAVWIDPKTNPSTLHIMLSNKNPIPPLNVPQQLKTLPLQIHGGDPIKTLIMSETDEEPYNANQICQNEPIALGTQIQPAGANWLGTAGAPVKWLDGNREPHWGILSNWHVMAAGGEQIGRPQHQPTASQPAIAALAAWSGPKPDQVNKIDAALADALVNGYHTIGANILGIGPIGPEPLPANVGLRVLKSGRTTGVTNARCTAVGAAVRVGYGDFTAAFVDQDLFTPQDDPFSAAGDSGSMIVDRLEHRPCSLLFAGSSQITVGNPMRHIVNAFNLVFPFP